MDAINFIEHDAKKVRRSPFVNVVWALSLAVVPPMLGLWLRRDNAGLSASIWMSSLLMLGISLMLPTLFANHAVKGRNKIFAAIVIFFVFTILSISRDGFPLGTEYANWQAFWAETETCFTKGLATGLLISVLSYAVTTKFYPTPTRFERVLSTAIGSVSGILMLNIHCPSGHVGHLFVGHWTQVAIIFVSSYSLQTWLFEKRMRDVLKDSVLSVKNLGKLS